MKFRKKSEETGWAISSLAAVASATLLSFLWNSKDNTLKQYSPPIAVATGTRAAVAAAPQRSLFDDME